MKLKTRLIITFLTIAILPVILTLITFAGISYFMLDNHSRLYGVDNVDYSMISDNMQTYCDITEDIFEELDGYAEKAPRKLESLPYLQDLDFKLREKSSYLLVRKNQEIYYTASIKLANKIFERLPDYQEDNEGNESGLYYYDMEKLVKQVNFRFRDGSEGGVFIVTQISNIVSERLLIDMFLAIVIILLITSVLLTRWIQKGVFSPIKELNWAIQRVAEGNLDYSIRTDLKGELGELYKNYEDMRLRLKESTEEKIANDKYSRELISNISHDLKTPITAIKGYVEGITDGVADTPEKMEKYLRTIYTKAKDMDQLINELTVYSKIDSNKIAYRFLRLDVGEYFRDCVEEVGLDLEAENIELNYTNFVEPNTKIIADPEQLKKVINNIIGNSIKYIDKERGVIDIRLIDKMDSVQIEIEDNGIGIANKDLSDIFERFYRTDASRNSATGGSGIGLSIVRKIIENHGGYIWATSEEGVGTCLHFVIRKYREVVGNV